MKIRKTCKNFITEMFLIACFVSAAVYWIREADFNISPLSFCKLIVLYLIIAPPLLLVSKKGLRCFKKIFGFRHKFLKISLYMICISFAYFSLSLQKVTSIDDIGYFGFVLSIMIYSFAVIWKPLLCVLAFRVLLSYRRLDTLNLGWQFAIIIIAYFLLKKIGYHYIHILGETGLRMELAKWLIRLSFIPENKYLFICSPALIKSFYLESWIHTLTFALLLSQVICLKNIGIENSELKIKEIFIKNPVIWIYIFLISINELNNAKLGFSTLIESIAFFFSVFIKALYEEIYFRGILQGSVLNILKNRELNEKIANLTAILIASTLFTLYHYPIYTRELGFVFLFGILSGRIYYKTNSIMPSTIAHGIINIVLHVTR